MLPTACTLPRWCYYSGVTVDSPDARPTSAFEGIKNKCSDNQFKTKPGKLFFTLLLEFELKLFAFDLMSNLLLFYLKTETAMGYHGMNTAELIPFLS